MGEVGRWGTSFDSLKCILDLEDVSVGTVKGDLACIFRRIGIENIIPENWESSSSCC